MFCKKCGNKLPDKALFCNKCGSKMQKSNNGNAGQQIVIKERQRKPMAAITKILVLEVIVIAILAIVSYSKLREFTLPETVAKSYFAAVMSGDVEKAYGMIDADESEFINKKFFGEFLNNIGQKDVQNFKVDDLNDTEKVIDGQDISKTIKITYRLKGDTSDYDFYVELEKIPSKKYFLFDDWKINIGDYIEKDMTLYVNQGSEVELDGVKLSRDYIPNVIDEEGDSIYERYVIPRVFCGTYEVVITNDIYLDYKMSLNVSGEENTFYEDGEKMAIKPEVMEEVAKQSQTDFKSLWSSAVQQKASGNHNEIYTIKDNSGIAEEYAELTEKIHKEDDTGLQKINFGKFNIMAERGDDEVYPSVNVNFTAPLSYVKIEKDWWSGELVSSEGSAEYSGNMNYVYQDGKWLLSNMSLADFYY